MTLLRENKVVRRATLCLGTLAMLIGCSAGQVAGGPDAGEASGTFAEGAVSRLTSTDNGLQVRKWLVPAEPEQIAAAFERLEATDSADAQTHARMKANGLRLFRVGPDQLNQLQTALGELTMDATAWFGQVTRWRPMQSRRVPNQGTVVAIDGHLERFREGALQLALRCWTVPMEEQPVVQLELALHQRVPRSQRDLRRLMELGAGEDVRPISSLRVDLPLHVNEFLVLATVVEEQSEQDLADAAQPSEAIGLPGPAVEVPPTIGRWLLDTESPRPLRGIYVFSARIPEALFPSDASNAGETDESL